MSREEAWNQERVNVPVEEALADTHANHQQCVTHTLPAMAGSAVVAAFRSRYPAARTFKADDLIPVEPKKGWLLIVEQANVKEKEVINVYSAI